MAKKKSFLEIAGGIFLSIIGVIIIANSSELGSLIISALFIGIGIALLLKD